MKEDFISLQNDFAFKFTMRNKKVLRGFLAAVLKENPEDIIDIIYLDTHLEKEGEDEKQGILDTLKTQKVFSDKITFYMVQLKQMKNVPEEGRDELYYGTSLIAAKSQEECEIIAKWH